MPGKVFLEGDDIELRTVEREDLEFLRDGVNHPDVRVHMDNQRPQNMESEEAFFENVIKDGDDVHLLICKEEGPMGIISLNEKDEASRLAEVGIWLYPEYHGNGYGTEASKLVVNHGFDQLNYRKIYARAFGMNKASQRVWEKLGFTEEGKLRDHKYMQGEYGDVIYYGLLEGERE